MNDFLSLIGTLASVAGLIITAITYVKVKNLEARYLFAARAPELVQRLNEQASNLVEYLRDFSRSTEPIRAELLQTVATLKSLERKASEHERASVKQLLKLIQEHDARVSSEESAWKIYSEIRKVEEEVRNAQEDLKWRR